MTSAPIEARDVDNGITLFVLLISAVATIGGFLFGFDSGVINGTVSGLEEAFGTHGLDTGWNVASMLLGCAAGAFFAGRFADRYGRRTVLIFSSVFFIISAWGSGVANSSAVFVVFRVIGGLAVGAASVMAPAYISEVAPARFRGRLATLQQVAIIAGLFCAFLSNYLLASLAGSATSELWLGYKTWRWMFWVEIAPAAGFFLSLLFIPESPRFLVARGRKAAAEKVLARVLGAAVAQRKVDEIDASLAADHHRPRLADLIDKTTRRPRKIVWVGIGLATFQQLVGINVVFYYGAVLWQSVGFSESHALLINVISGAISIAACIVAILLVDRVGRKPLLWVGSIGMTLTLGVMAAAFATGTIGSDGNLILTGAMGTAALIAGNAYVFFFNGSWGPVMWVMLGEMFPNQIRGSGLAVSGLAQWIANFAISISFPLLLTSIGLTGAYSLYTLFALISVVFIFKSVHETNGVELEQMKG